MWWLFHISAVFCGIKFPLCTRSFKNSSHVKYYVHIGLVIAGILIPVVPVAALASASGFSTSFPPIYCYAVNGTVVFYAMVFPCCVFGASGVSLIVGITWIVIKVITVSLKQTSPILD